MTFDHSVQKPFRTDPLTQELFKADIALGIVLSCWIFDQIKQEVRVL
jgi:hypothetical protein